MSLWSLRRAGVSRWPGSFERWAARDGGACAKWLEIALAAVAAVAGVYVLVSTVAMVVGDWSALPYGDQWDELVFSKNQVFSSWLYSQHNEHRILLPRLIFAVDTWLFAETNKFDFFCNLLFSFGLAALIAYIAGRGSRQLVRSKVWTAGVAFALVFSAMQQENFVWGFQSAFFLVELAAVATFALLALGKPNFVTLFAAILCEAVAVYTMAGGMTVPFLAIPVAFWARRSKPQLAILVAAALLLLASYLHGYVTPGDLSDPSHTAMQIRGVAAHAFAQLGSPLGIVLTHFGVDVRWSVRFGQLGFILFAVAAGVMLSRRESGRWPEIVLLATAAFAFGIALLTGLGRLKFGVGQALSSRYTTPALLFWLSLATIAMIYADRRYPRLRLIVMALALPCLIGLAVSQPMFVKLAARDMPLNSLDATTALLANVNDGAALIRVHPRPSVVLAQTSRLRAQHLSIFADRWSDWLGSKLADHVTFTDPTACHGDFAKAWKLVLASDRPAWQASGSAWDTARQSIAERVVLTDAAGRVVGYALTAHVAKPGADEVGGWHGHFTADDPSSVSAFALVDDDRRACPLGRPLAVVNPPALLVSDSHPANLPAGGYLDSVTTDDGYLMLNGWGLVRGESAGWQVTVDTNLPVKSRELGLVGRPDVVSAMHDPRLADAGIVISLQLRPDAPLPSKPRICVWTDDAVFGRHLLLIPTHPELCPADSP